MHFKLIKLSELMNTVEKKNCKMPHVTTPINSIEMCECAIRRHTPFIKEKRKTKKKNEKQKNFLSQIKNKSNDNYGKKESKRIKAMKIWVAFADFVKLVVTYFHLIKTTLKKMKKKRNKKETVIIIIMQVLYTRPFELKNLQ